MHELAGRVYITVAIFCKVIFFGYSTIFPMVFLPFFCRLPFPGLPVPAYRPLHFHVLPI
nr:MAG TPA: hypothetical protein [Caudoviricetes sp.]